MPLMRSTTACFAPSPTASIAMTEPTPITMPSSVSAVRKRFARSARPAALPASTRPAQPEPAIVASERAAGTAAASGAAAPGSLTIIPSRISITRCACAATSCECVMTMTVWPLRESSFEQREHFDAALAVERAGRLVGEDDLAAVHERARDRDALLLAARELVRLVLEALGEPERARAALRRARGARPADMPGVDRGHLDVLASRSRRRSGCSSGRRSRTLRGAAARARRGRTPTRPRP